MMDLATRIKEAEQAQTEVDARRALEATAAALPDLLDEKAKRERQAQRRRDTDAALVKATALLDEAGERCTAWRQRFDAVLAELSEMATALPETQAPIQEARHAILDVAARGGPLAARLWEDAGGGDASLALPRGTGFSKTLPGMIMHSIRREVAHRAGRAGERRPSVRATVYDPKRGI